MSTWLIVTITLAVIAVCMGGYAYHVSENSGRGEQGSFVWLFFAIVILACAIISGLVQLARHIIGGW